jgi:electron-transferring-flavoprotein dehydrogenase
MITVTPIDVLFVGAGPGSLSGAIRLKQLLNDAGRTESVAVIEKSEKLGQHILSGLVFESQVLDDLIPDWREHEDPFVGRARESAVDRDETLFLPNGTRAWRLPEFVVPPYMRNQGKLILSGSDMVGERGLDREGRQQANYVPSEAVEARVTVFGEGSLGRLAEQVIEHNGLARGRNPQVFSVGVKEVIRLPEGNAFGTNHVIHTFGYPVPAVFGGGTLYSMGKNTVAVALVMGLDWEYADLNPYAELQRFKAHAHIARLLEGGETIAYGAKTLPEGGYYSLPQPYTDGALIVGDAAGFTDVRKLKGWHNAMRSGLLAGEAIARALERGDVSEVGLKAYDDLVWESPVMADLRRGRNYRQVFAKGGSVYVGAPLSILQRMIPTRLGAEPDHEAMGRKRLDHDAVGSDRLTGVALSGTIHREEEPPHITISDPTRCVACGELYGVHPCVCFCPGEVYAFVDGELALSVSNCLHCQTCRDKCPEQVIDWHLPEGGEGPKYKVM